MRNYDLWIVFDEDLGPEVLDEWIREKIEADPAVVFSENLGEKYSVNRMCQTCYRSADSTRK